MTRPPFFAFVLLCLSLGATAPGAQAQTPENPTVPGELSMGRDPNAPASDAVGSTYVKESHGAWEVRCVRTEDGKDPCQMYQLLRDSEGNAVAELSIFALPEGGPAAAGASIVAPLETLLTEEVTVAIDNNPAKKYPFAWCSPVGCVARLGITADEVAAMRRGNVARIAIVPVIAPDQQVVVEASLSGFTNGFNAVSAAAGQ
ncbi:MAG TPA: invasion associated locus B family protein [Paracoccaceae bacterium]|jgi:invasion protein IalB|nr:invasion associated locus B family protein [Paracoccaceae bacterium]